MNYYLNGFPTAEELGQKSVLGGLSSLLKLMKIASNYGQTSVVTKELDNKNCII